MILSLIDFQELLEHLDLIEGIIVDLLKTKWNSFIKKEFYRQIYTFTIYFFISTFCFVSRPMTPGITCVNASATTVMTTLNYTNGTTLMTPINSDSSIEDVLTTLHDEDYSDVTSSPLIEGNYH